MPYCPDCGAEVDAGAKFCSDCGMSLDSDPDGGDTAGAIDAETDIEETEEDGGINYRRAGAAFLFGLIPALGAYIGVSIALYDAVGIVLLIAIPVFTYLLYQRRTKKAMLGGVSYFLAIETLLTPLALLIYTFVFASQETTTAAGGAGAAIGGFFLVVIAFVVGVPLAGVLYLISRKLDTEESRGVAA